MYLTGLPTYLENVKVMYKLECALLGQPDSVVCRLQTFAAMCVCVGGGGFARKVTFNVNTAPCTIVLCRAAILPDFLYWPESALYNCTTQVCMAQLYKALQQSAMYSTTVHGTTTVLTVQHNLT